MQEKVMKNWPTIGPVSRELGLSPDWIRKLEKEGKLTAQRLQNGVRVYDPSEIERFRKERAGGLSNRDSK